VLTGLIGMLLIAEFNWDDVKADKHRENYLGHSVKAPVGRWQKGVEKKLGPSCLHTCSESEIVSRCFGQ
jgi:hypothetical protein